MSGYNVSVYEYNQDGKLLKDTEYYLDSVFECLNKFKHVMDKNIDDESILQGLVHVTIFNYESNQFIFDSNKF